MKINGDIMKKDRELIIINGKNRTDTIAEYSFDESKCNVRFTNGPKIYSYNKANVKILPYKGSIDFKSYKVIVNGSPQNDLIDVWDFGDYFGIHSKNGDQKIYNSKDVQFKRYCSDNPSSKTLLEYFEKLADCMSLKNVEGASILSKQFSKVKSIDEDNILSIFLEEGQIKVNKENIPIEIYPFGLNSSQKIATANALSSCISVIEGPPGTGKTQTILNIIANIVLQNKTVAVVSGNNSATANVLEKFNKSDLGFICASLGSSENKNKFVDSQTNDYPDMTNWLLAPEIVLETEKFIKHITLEITDMLQIQNKIAKLRQSLSDLKHEQKHFDLYFQENFRPIKKKGSLLKLTSEDIIQLWLECESFAEVEKQPHLWFRLKCSLLYRIGPWKFYNHPATEIIAIFQDLYYGIRKKELEDQLTLLEKQLIDYDFKEKMYQLTKKSMQLFKAKLAERYDFRNKRQRFSLDSLRRESYEVTKEYPVILSTTYSIQTSLCRDYEFDYIIIDEASQVDLLTGLISLATGRNAVIVGDLKQLPNVITNEDKKKANNISDKYHVKECFDFSKNSLLSSILSALPNAPRTMLQEHYRCHPKIIEFCNKKFYNDQLIIMTQDQGEMDVLGVRKTVEGNHARGHINQRQIDVVVNEILSELNVSPDVIGIVTPYRAQANKITEYTDSNITVDTVHKYQGREKENIIISTVDNQIGEFADDPNLLNVAVSRAVKRLRVVISPDEYNERTNTGDLVKYIKYQRFDVQQSNIRSIFDLLYKAYAEKRKDFLSRHKRISEFDSENLMYGVIQYLLAEESFKSLDVSVRPPLYEIIKNNDSLTDTEKQYVKHRSSHIDFAITNKMDQKPILAIEVDGVAYHQEGSTQSKRDQLKNTILSKYDIPLLRLRTDGSSEEEKIRKRLLELTQNRR